MPEQLDDPLDGRGAPTASKAPSWETVTLPSLDRIEVPGGWLYRSTYGGGTALAFVPRTYDEARRAELRVAVAELLAVTDRLQSRQASPPATGGA